MTAIVEDKYLSYSASLITQGRHKFYTLTIPSDVLARTCFVIQRDEDPVAGFQRLLNAKRAQEIANYIDAGLGTIPTSIVLSAQEVAEFEYNSKNKSVRFLDNKKSFLILDGQHRIFGFHLAKTQLRVPVVVYSELTRVVETRLFIDINTTQKAVPNELLLDIRKLAEYRNDIETRLGNIFDLFATEPGSPLLGAMSPSKRKTEHISRVTFNTAVKNVLNLFGDVDDKLIFDVMSSYFNGLINTTKENNFKIDITTPIVFKAMIIIFPEITQRVKDKFGTKYRTEHFSSVINDMLKSIKPSAIKNVGTSVSAYAKIFTDGLKTKNIF